MVIEGFNPVNDETSQQMKDGDLTITTGLGICTKLGGGMKHLTQNEVSDGPFHLMRVGDTVLQSRMLLINVADGQTQFIPFVRPYTKDNVVVVITSADNDPNANIQLDGNSLPKRNGFTIRINAQNGSGQITYMAMGVSEQ